MSMYGDSSYNNEKNDLYGELKCFLEDHPISEMLQIVTDVVMYEVENDDKVSQESDTNDVLDKIKADIEKISTSIYFGLSKQEVFDIIENYKKE